MKTLNRILILIFFIPFNTIASDYKFPTFSENEKNIIESLSSKNYQSCKDISNRVSGNEQAIQWGKQLFFDKRLSGSGKTACATCHNPNSGWTKHEALSHIHADYPAKRHVPHLWNICYSRWFFWDGRADSLWSQALTSLEAPSEMNMSRINIANLIINTPTLKNNYQHIFTAIPSDLIQTFTQDNCIDKVNNSPKWKDLTNTTRSNINTLFVNIAKTIASFEETIITKDSRFDQFSQQLLSQKSIKKPAISIEAARGLKLFIGKAHCINCHSGANFSDGEFHHSFLQSKLNRATDLGRYNGINQLMQSNFNANSQYCDTNKKDFIKKVDFIYKSYEFRNQFKTPTLRNIEKTYPYMHTGQYENLREVINHYNTISNKVEVNQHKEILLSSLSLSESEINDLLEFLKTLTSH
jgi:cytochrome c peroxidase